MKHTSVTFWKVLSIVCVVYILEIRFSFSECVCLCSHFSSEAARFSRIARGVSHINAISCRKNVSTPSSLLVTGATS